MNAVFAGSGRAGGPPGWAAGPSGFSRTRVVHVSAGFKGPTERLDRLRERQLSGAQQSRDFLKELLDLTRQVQAANQASHDGTLDERADAILDPRIGALTQILRSTPRTTPVIMGNVVADIDTLVKQVAFTGWSDSHDASREAKRELRKRLNKYQLPPTGDLFDKAYAYIAENY